jgi:hypothetical protein
MKIGSFASVAVLMSAVALSAQSTRVQIYATALNDQGGPVRGLQTGDLVLRDGGVRQGVMDVEPAADPLSVAVVISGFGASDVDALTKGIDAVARDLHASNPATKVGVVAGAGDIAIISDGQTDWKPSVARAVSAPASFLDAILNGADALGIASQDRRVVLGIAQVPANAALAGADRLSTSLVPRHVALWTVETGASASAAWSAGADKALTAASDAGGALRLPVKDRAGLAEGIRRVADYLTAQYVVTYGWPDPMLSTFSLVTRHDAGKVLTPGWTR